MLNLVAIRNNGLKFKTEISAVRPLNVIAPVSDTPLSGVWGLCLGFLLLCPGNTNPTGGSLSHSKGKLKT